MIFGIMRYREAEISDERAHDLIIRSVDAEAIPPQRFRSSREWREPWHQEFVPKDGVVITQRLY